MKFHPWLAWLVLMPGIMAACANSQSDAGSTTIPFTVIAKGQYGGVSQRQFRVIDNPARWQSLWQTHSGRRGNVPPVDFSDSRIIAVFMGEQRTGGYGVDIHRIQQYDDTVMVEVAERKPDPDRMVTMALTQPYIMVRIPRVKAEIRFKLVSPGSTQDQ